MRRRADPRDEQRLAHVTVVLAELTRDGPVPAVRLVNGASMMLCWHDTLRMKRREADEMTDQELRGTIAHELGHLRDPLRVRDRRIGAALLGVLVASSLAGLSVGWTVWRPALAAMLLVIAIVFTALLWRSRRAEYRADALGARISSAEDVTASLEYMQRSYLHRWADRLFPATVSSHPRIAQRRRALSGRGNRAARSSLAVLAGSRDHEGIEKC